MKSVPLAVAVGHRRDSNDIDNGDPPKTARVVLTSPSELSASADSFVNEGAGEGIGLSNGPPRTGIRSKQ